MSHIEDAMELWMGPRCSDLEPDCAACQGWAEVDEIDRLRAELAEAERTNHLLMRNAAENWRDKAAIARVRELCAGGFTSCVRCDGVLRALDGGTK